jgi:hypothetical protein
MEKISNKPSDRRQEGWFTPTELASDLGLPRAIVLNWVHEDMIPTTVQGNRRYIDKTTYRSILDQTYPWIRDD